MPPCSPALHTKLQQGRLIKQTKGLWSGANGDTRMVTTFSSPIVEQKAFLKRLIKNIVVGSKELTINYTMPWTRQARGVRWPQETPIKIPSITTFIP